MIYVRVNEILKEQKKTKYWLIKNMECGYQSLTHMMNNETVAIHFSTLEKLCDVLDCEPGEIIIRKKGKKNNEQASKSI